MIPRLVIAGTASGVGKTSVTCGIIWGLRKKGYSVQPFKVGPDYIDPSYLRTVSGNEAHNLDIWMMGRRKVLQSFAQRSHSDISVIEGVMGMYDGFAGGSNLSSTHHVSSILKAPTILVLDASSTSRSIAATALGFKRFSRGSGIAGVILNRLGSDRHYRFCSEALDSVGIPVLGAIRRSDDIRLRSRHLGLVPADEGASVRRKIIRAAKTVSESIDIDAVASISKRAGALKRIQAPRTTKSRASIAVALDGSFNFYYKDNLDALERHGCTVKFFSPVSDRRLPDCDGMYLGGGFPEVLAQALEKNTPMRKQIRDLAQDGMPVYAECGGLMYLTRSILAGKRRFRMTGLFDAETVMTGRPQLGYTRGRFESGCLISGKGRAFRGHEFHYSRLAGLSRDARFACRMELGGGIQKGRDGLMVHNALGSYGHLYFDSSDYAAGLASQCIAYSRG